MSDFITVRNVPDAPDGYETWNNAWVFGLPEQGELSSPTCGAMPFRDGDGLCSPYCLRGEDKAFLHSALVTNGRLPSITIWPSLSPYPPYSAYANLRRDTINGYYTALSNIAAASCYGSGIVSENYGATMNDYRDAPSVISAFLTGFMQLESEPLSDDVLRLSQMSALFADTKKMQCTITDGAFEFTGTSRTIYNWSSPVIGYGNNTLDVSDISSVQTVNQYGPQHQKISAEGMVIIVVECEWDQNNESRETNVAVMCGGKFEMTTSQNNPRILKGNVNVTAQQIANVVGNVTGWNMRPSGNHDWSASCTLRNRRQFLVIWPKWLVDY